MARMFEQTGRNSKRFTVSAKGTEVENGPTLTGQSCYSHCARNTSFRSPPLKHLFAPREGFCLLITIPTPHVSSESPYCTLCTAAQSVTISALNISYFDLVRMMQTHFPDQ